MKIYLAARYDRREELCHYADKLRGEGYTVDCRWLNGSHQLHPGAEKVEAAEDTMPMEAGAFAQDDIEDLRNADILIFFSERPSANSKRGGCHVEFGIALALGHRLIVVGARENVFHCLPDVEQYHCFDDCLEAL